MAHRPYTIDTSYSANLHPLPNLLSRNRSESRLIRTSATEMPQANTTMVTQIRRRHKKIQKSVDPELAAAVVKNYLLPMFEAKSKSFAALNRSSKFGTESRQEVNDFRLSTGETVYSDLKLTEKLMGEIEMLRQSLENSNRETRDAKQKLISTTEETNQIKEKFENLEMNFELIKFQLSQQFKVSQTSELKGRLILEQLNRYKKLYIESTSREEELNSKLHKERSKNDIR